MHSITFNHFLKFPIVLWWLLVTFWTGFALHNFLHHFVHVCSCPYFHVILKDIHKSFISTSRDVSIKCAIVTHLNKRCPDNVIITSVCFFLCCSGALTCESPVFLWTCLTSDLSSMSRRQQMAAAAIEGSQLVLTHRLQFRLTGPCLLRGNNEWVRRLL